MIKGLKDKRPNFNKQVTPSVLTKTVVTDKRASGVAGATRRGSQTEQHGRPLRMSRHYRDKTGGCKETMFHQVHKVVGVAHSTDSISRTTQP